MFTATGAATATSPTTDSVSPGVSVSAGQTSTSPPQPAFVDPEETASRRQQTVEATFVAVRAATAARVARSAVRQKLAARSLGLKRAAQARTWQLPIRRYVLTSGFGSRWGRLHAGEDFAAPVGTDLVSMSTGTVTFAGEQSGYGVMVKIRYWDGTVAHYAHMSTIAVTVGQSVKPGEVVGLSGNTGESTGPHMHLEIHPGGGAPIDPLPWLAARKIPA